MDQKGRGRGRGGGGRGGAGGRGGGENSRTDLLAAGRKKVPSPHELVFIFEEFCSRFSDLVFRVLGTQLQQFRKKKDKKGPGKKADTDEGASVAGANGEEAVLEPKSPVGLKFLAGEGGSSHSTPFEVKLVFLLFLRERSLCF